MSEKNFYIYILTNPGHTVFYTGYTENLSSRIYQHQSKMADGFTKRYHVTKLVYYEVATDKFAALEREKQIKNYRRQKKIDLIQTMNPAWNDLTNSL